MRRKTRRWRTPLVIALVVSGLTTDATAQMLGSELRADWRFPRFGDVLESHLVKVSEEIELREEDIEHDNDFYIDLASDTVSFVFNAGGYWQRHSFNGWYFEDVQNVLPAIVGYELDFYSGVGSLAIEPGWTENAFWANFRGTEIDAGDEIRMRVLFVPAPGTVAVMSVGTLVALRRRRG